MGDGPASAGLSSFQGRMWYGATMPDAPELKEKQTDAWHRQLRDGRVEIMCKAPGYRIRVSAPEEQAWEVVELFEKWTGLNIGSDRRPRRVPAQVPGQLPLTMGELESSDNGAAPCGTPDEEF